MSQVVPYLQAYLVETGPNVVVCDSGVTIVFSPVLGRGSGLVVRAGVASHFFTRANPTIFPRPRELAISYHPPPSPCNLNSPFAGVAAVASFRLDTTTRSVVTVVDQRPKTEEKTKIFYHLVPPPPSKVISNILVYSGIVKKHIGCHRSLERSSLTSPSEQTSKQHPPWQRKAINRQEQCSAPSWEP
jgi:hypothetical protein